MPALATGFRMPFDGSLTLTQDYGVSGGLSDLPTYIHLGEDYGGAKGTPIKAVANGKIVNVTTGNASFGNSVTMEHKLSDDSTVYSLYAHLSSISVTIGQDILMGDTLGGLGNTGAADGYHLHFEISFENKFLQSGMYGKGYDSPTEFVTSSTRTVDPSKFISEHPVTSTQTGGSQADILWGLSSNETLKGNGGNDTIFGNGGNDSLYGGSDNDILSGGTGNDYLSGETGKDTLTGGSGYDIFDFNKYSELGNSSTTWDVITDFARGYDKIDLSTLDANPATSTNNAFSFISSGTAFTTAGQVKFLSGVLYGNTDSDSTSEFAIQLTGITLLASSDMIL